MYKITRGIQTSDDFGVAVLPSEAQDVLARARHLTGNVQVNAYETLVEPPLRMTLAADEKSDFRRVVRTPDDAADMVAMAASIVRTLQEAYDSFLEGRNTTIPISDTDGSQVYEVAVDGVKEGVRFRFTPRHDQAKPIHKTLESLFPETQ